MARITIIKDKIRQMNQASFQIMCDDYLNKKGYKNIVSLGTMTGAEKTTRGTPDTYVSFSDGKYTFIEYTVQQKSVAKKIKEDIEKCLDENKTGIAHDLISKIVYIHNSSNFAAKDDLSLKEYCMSFGIPLTLIGIDTLAADLMQHFPSIVYDHLGVSFDTRQVQGIDDFVEQYDNNKTVAPLDTVFMFREKEMEQVAEKLEAVNIIIITAPAGTGKTRFALEYARRHAQEHNEQIICIHNQGLVIHEDFHMTFEDPGSYFVIIDDANQLSDLDMIIRLFNLFPSDHIYKILITVRDYAKERVGEILNKIVRYDLIELHPLTDDEIGKLIKQHFGTLNQKCLDRIVVISDGNPRIAMLAGKTAMEANTLDSIRDVSDLYDAYYGSALRESTIPENSTRLISAGIVAFLGVIHLEHIVPIYKMLESKGISETVFRAAMQELHSAEMVDISHDTAVKISDQCLADYILKYVFCDRKLISLGEMILTCLKPYHGRTIRAINMLYGKYQNNEMRAFLDEEIRKVWNQLKAEQSDLFWDFLKAFFPVNPLETLVILKEKIHQVNRISIPASQIDTNDGKNNVSISDDYIAILSGYSGTTSLDAALDLFFAYYLKRPDLYMQFYHSSCNSYGINKGSHENGFYTQLHYIQKAFQYSENWNNDYIVILFLEVMQNFLKLHFEPVENGRNNNLVIYQIPLYPSEATAAYRNLAWSHLIAIARMGKQHDRLRELLKNYGDRTEECSFDVVKNDAPYVFQIIDLVLSTDCLLDCLMVKNISEKLMRIGIDTSILGPYLSGEKIEKFHILVGPDWRKDTPYDEMQKLHRQNIEGYFNGSKNRAETFNDLYEISRELIPQDYGIVTGINYALEELSSDQEGFVAVVKKIMSSAEPGGINLSFIVHTLFKFMCPAEVKYIVDSYADTQRDIWMYLYFLEMPSELIDEGIVRELYTFLTEEQPDFSKGIPMRNHRFLEKYTIVDGKVFVKATEILFGKRIQQPYLVISYFGGMFGDKKNPSKIINAYSDSIQLLCDLYIFLYVSGWNMDHDGIYLCKLLDADLGMIEKLADAIIEFKRRNPYNDTDTRFCALFYTDKYIETISYIVDKVIEHTEYSTIFVPDTLSAFFLIPQKKPDIIDLQQQWVTTYIRRYAMNTEKMECVFRTVANHRFDMMKSCVAAFIERNKDFDVFKNLVITPTSYEAFGSFVPHYSKCIEVLKSLLPLFTDIDTIQHKYAVEQEIEVYKRRIREEEISNIITG